MTNELQKDGVVLQQHSKEDYHWRSHLGSGSDKAMSRARRHALLKVLNSFRAN